jgi:nitrite reductase/ring-hydroxylating ferredoxin subunit
LAASERLICASEDLIDGGRGVRFVIERQAGMQPAFAVRYNGKVHAYINQCGHVPVELDWNEGEFFDLSRLYLVCSTHGAMYDPSTGACLGGRCDGRGLKALVLLERNGNVYLKLEGD